MGAIPFDTLKPARRLESAGFPPKQAGDTTEASAEAMSGAELATHRRHCFVRAEIELLRRDLTIRLGGMIVVALGIILAAIRCILPPH